MKRALVTIGLLTVAAALGIGYAWRGGQFPAEVIAVPAPPPASWSVEVTYIANEGVLLRSGDTQILIDGLFREYSSYPFLPQPYQEQLEAAVPPFDAVDLILVSHRHGDHFHPAAVSRYLQHNQTTRLVTSAQVAGELQAQASSYAAIASRITTVTPPVGQKQQLTVADVPVEILGLGHGSRHADIQNLGHVVTIGGQKVLHVGDADPSAGVFETFNLDERGIDIALLPVWFLTDFAHVVREHIRPRHIIAVHMARGAAGLDPRAVREFPHAVPFVRLLEKRYY